MNILQAKIQHLIVLVTITFISIFIFTPGFALQSENVMHFQADTVGPNVISLAGEWKFRFDPENKGIAEEWFKKSDFGDMINLPGTTDEQKKGQPETEQVARFTRIHAYNGVAWYKTVVDIPKEFEGKASCIFDGTEQSNPGLV